MPALTCLIIDDEAPAREELAFLLSRIRDVRVIGEADTPRTAIEKISTLKPALIFLDIQMPGGSGFDVVAALQEMPDPPLVVFATAFDQYAVRAFDEKALDYILKPFEADRVAKAVRRAVAQRQHNTPRDLSDLLSALSSVPKCQKIPVEHNGRIRLFDPADIVYISTEDKQTRVHSREKHFHAHTNPSLDALEQRLSSASFFRPHRSFLINLDQVSEFYPWFNGRYELVMNTADSTKVPVSKKRVKSFKERIGF